MKEDIWLSRKVIGGILTCLESYVVHAEVCGNHLHTDKMMLAEELAEMLHEKLKRVIK
jgi:oligoribonuclease (3'-5' exoribonuclease)